MNRPAFTQNSLQIASRAKNYEDWRMKKLKMFQSPVFHYVVESAKLTKFIATH